MTTMRDIINSAMRKINVLGVGSTLEEEEVNDAFESLKGMVASWSTNGALIYTETTETFPLTGSVSYTIGSGADFNTVVPRDIKSAYVTYAGYDIPVDIIGSKTYSTITDKDETGTPDKIFFDSNYPTANIYVWPVGYSGTTLTITSEKPLTEITSLDDVFSMPPEYERALKFNLAIEVAPEYEAEASPTVRQIASRSLKNIERQNRKNNKGIMKVDRAFLGRNRGSYDINRGY